MRTERAVVSLIKRSNSDEETEYLFIKSTPKDEYREHQNKYFPPSGHLEEGETEEEALVREMMEELGVEARPLRRIVEMPSDVPGHTLIWWECKILSEDFKLQESEIAEARWFTVEQIKGMDLWPATDKFFKEHIYGK